MTSNSQIVDSVWIRLLFQPSDLRRSLKSCILMDDLDLSDPLDAHRSELLHALFDAVKLEFEVRRIRGNPREEDISRFYTAQSALDEKCRAISSMTETRRSRLRFYDYIDSLVRWSGGVLNVTTKYMEAQAPRNPLDFCHIHRSPDTAFSVDHCALWIEHLEKRIAISHAYLEKTSRKDRQAKSSNESVITPDGGSESGERRVVDMVSTDAPSLEIREHSEHSPWLSDGPTSKRSELLQRVIDFHESHSTHKAALTTVADEVQKVLQQKNVLPVIDDLELFQTQVRTEATQVLCDDMPGILGAIRLELLLQSLNFQEEVYADVWETTRPILDITESAHMQLHTGCRHATIQSN